VTVVDASHKVGAGQLAPKVADVVEERRGNERVGRAGGLSKGTRLAHVLCLADRLAEICSRSLARKEPSKLVDRFHSRRSSTAIVLNSPSRSA
jgi:hypothetical protein